MINNRTIPKALPLAIIATLLLLLSACSEPELSAPEPPAEVRATPQNWLEYQAGEIADKAKYISDHQRPMTGSPILRLAKPMAYR